LEETECEIDFKNNKIQIDKGIINIYTITAEEKETPIKAFLPFGADIRPGDNFLNARASKRPVHKYYIVEKARNFEFRT
jgi:hypothetical protein